MENIPIRFIDASEKEPNFNEGFRIREVGDLLSGKDMVQALHRHDFFFVLALQKGKGHHEIDFTSYKIGNNSIFFMRPGQVHQLTLKVGSIGYLIEFNSDFWFSHNKSLHQLLRKASLNNVCHLDTHGFKKLLSVLTNIFQEFRLKQERYQEVIKANLSIFFIELLRNKKTSKRSSVIATAYMQERLDEFLELLETHFAKHKQVSQYAAMMNLSIYQLNAITKTTSGKTCSELINEYIILESKRYLLATSNQVNQIAFHLGYEDISYFIRFFKKHTGYSPEVFRSNFT